MPALTPNHDPGERLGLLLRDSARLFRAVVDRRLEPLGLSQAQWRPLIALHISDKPMTQIELARLLDIEAPTLVRLLDRLGDKGWIERHSSPEDRRVRHIVLTQQSQGLVTQIQAVLASVRQEVFGHLTSQQLSDCCDLLDSVMDRLSGGSDDEEAAQERGDNKP